MELPVLVDNEQQEESYHLSHPPKCRILSVKTVIGLFQRLTSCRMKEVCQKWKGKLIFQRA